MKFQFESMGKMTRKEKNTEKKRVSLRRIEYEPKIPTPRTRNKNVNWTDGDVCMVIIYFLLLPFLVGGNRLQRELCVRVRSLVRSQSST